MAVITFQQIKLQTKPERISDWFGDYFYVFFTSTWFNILHESKFKGINTYIDPDLTVLNLRNKPKEKK